MVDDSLSDEGRLSYSRADIYWSEVYNDFCSCKNYYRRVGWGEKKFYIRWASSLAVLFGDISYLLSKENRKKIEKMLNKEVRNLLNQGKFKEAYPKMVYIHNKFGALITSSTLHKRIKISGLRRLSKELLG